MTDLRHTKFLQRPVVRPKEGFDMPAVTCLIFLLCPAMRLDDGAKTTVTGRQADRPVKFQGGLGTYYEGLVVALLGNCSSASGATVATKERWENALKALHLRIQFANPRRFAVTGDSPEVEVEEIIVPISASRAPDHIYVRSGTTYQAFAKYEHKICSFIQDNLKSLQRQ
jgi:hypothetical protein